MKLENAFETVPSDDDLLYSIEHWGAERLDAADGVISGRVAEAFVHPNTGTAARIMKSDGEYSIQPSMGDFGPYDNVVQSDDPTTMVGGGASVVMMKLETLSEARAIAYVWMHGWVMRNSHIGDEEGDVYDSNRSGTVTLR